MILQIFGVNKVFKIITVPVFFFYLSAHFRTHRFSWYFLALHVAKQTLMGKGGQTITNLLHYRWIPGVIFSPSFSLPSTFPREANFPLFLFVFMKDEWEESRIQLK